MLEKSWGLYDKDAPRAIMILEHSHATGKIKGSRWATRGSLNHTVTSQSRGNLGLLDIWKHYVDSNVVWDVYYT